MMSLAASTSGVLHASNPTKTKLWHFRQLVWLTCDYYFVLNEWGRGSCYSPDATVCSTNSSRARRPPHQPRARTRRSTRSRGRRAILHAIGDRRTSGVVTVTWRFRRDSASYLLGDSCSSVKPIRASMARTTTTAATIRQVLTSMSLYLRRLSGVRPSCSKLGGGSFGFCVMAGSIPSSTRP